ncbi:MAG: hypothetical protein MK052_05960 [Alphaproteobacteria bacterium]|nr:hypothetical protein [Alphaproteobacteria bacterium]
MHVVLFFIIFKLAVLLLAVTLGAMFVAEFFPIMADKAVSSSSGTAVAIAGEYLSVGLKFMAKYANMFVNLVFEWLNAFGIDVQKPTFSQSMESVNLESPKNVEKPEF